MSPSHEQSEKTSLDQCMDLIAVLKDMAHYAQSNMEKLAEYWLYMEDEGKRKDIAAKLQDLQSQQGKLHDSLQAAIEFLEMETNRIRNEGGTTLQD
jgi:hypothetical protein